jgi:adenosylcobyric acid synthase
MFESAEVMRALFGTASRTLNEVFDGLADFIDVHFTPDALLDLIGGTKNHLS